MRGIAPSIGQRFFVAAALAAGLFTSAAPAAEISLAGEAVVYTYAERPMTFRLRAEQAKVRIDDIDVSAGFVHVDGCKGAQLGQGESCALLVRSGSPDIPDWLDLGVTLHGERKVARLRVFKATAPYAFWVVEQESDAQQAKASPNIVHLPWTRLGEQGDPIDLHLRNQHFDALRVVAVQAPDYITLKNECDGKTLASPLTDRDEAAGHCLLQLAYSPTRAEQIDGEVVLTLADAKTQYSLVLQLKARPWQPLRARKIAVTEDHRYVLLHDGSLWRDGLKGAWSLVAEQVDDFEAGPADGLAILQAGVYRARGSGYRHRFGPQDDAADAQTWTTLPSAIERLYLAQEATYYRDTQGQWWEMGRRHVYWDGKGRYPGEDESPRRIAPAFVRVYQDTDAVYGIDTAARLWMRGSAYERRADNVLYPLQAADWRLRETKVAQYEDCGSDEFKLDTDGVLYTRGGNYLGKLGAGQQVQLTRWTRVNAQVAAFATDCSRRGVPHSMSSLYVLKQDRTLWGVGNNRHGQLGAPPGPHDHSLRWKLIARDVASFAADEYRVLMLKTDGTVWGSGSHQADITKRHYQNVLGEVQALGDFRRP